MAFSSSQLCSCQASLKGSRARILGPLAILLLHIQNGCVACQQLHRRGMATVGR